MTSDEPDAGHRPGDGTTSARLRAAEDAAVVTRRGVLWRAGLAAAVGAGALTALETERADAATGGNFVLGQANDAGSTTLLTPSASTSSNPLFRIDGSAMNATATTVDITGPNGGAALHAGGFSTTRTVGLAINGTGTGTANGISGSSSGGAGVLATSGSGPGLSASSATNAAVKAVSTSGTGVDASSSSGVGVRATSTSGTALSVTGKVHFSHSGAASITQGSKAKTIKVSGMTASSLVLVTLQTTASGIYLAGAVPGSGAFTVRLNKAAPKSMRFAWFVIN